MRLLLIPNKLGKLFNNYSALSVGDLSFVEMRGICLSSPPCGRFDFSGLVLLDGIHFAVCLFRKVCCLKVPRATVGEELRLDC